MSAIRLTDSQMSQLDQLLCQSARGMDDAGQGRDVYVAGGTVDMYDRGDHHLWKPADGETLPPTLTVDQQGNRAIFQTVEPDGSARLRALPLASGWHRLRNQFKSPETLTALPAPADCLDYGPGGQVALVRGREISEWTPESGLRHRADLPETLGKEGFVEYLPDGSLGIRACEDVHNQLDSRYFLLPVNASQPVALDLWQASASTYEHAAREQLQDVPLLNYAPASVLCQLDANRGVSEPAIPSEHVWKHDEGTRRTALLQPESGQLGLYLYQDEDRQLRRLGSLPFQSTHGIQLEFSPLGTAVEAFAGDGAGRVHYSCDVDTGIQQVVEDGLKSAPQGGIDVVGSSVRIGGVELPRQMPAGESR